MIPSIAQQLASAASSANLDDTIIQALQQRPMVVRELAVAIDASVQQVNARVTRLRRAKLIERRSTRRPRNDGDGYRTVWRYKVRKPKQA